jgi:hypothetical protein
MERFFASAGGRREFSRRPFDFHHSQTRRPVKAPNRLLKFKMAFPTCVSARAITDAHGAGSADETVKFGDLFNLMSLKMEDMQCVLSIFPPCFVRLSVSIV